MSQFNTHSGFTVEVDQMSRQEWAYYLRQFDDANLYQTWQYNTSVAGEKRIGNIVLRHEGEVVALGMVRIVTLPIVCRGIAYVYMGPLWRPKGRQHNLDNLNQILRGMYDEYVLRRQLVLRVFPNVIDRRSKGVVSLLESVGMSRRKSKRNTRTFLLDISPSLEEIRKSFNKKWRNRLNSSERKNLTVRQGKSDDLFGIVCQIHEEMRQRKNFVGLGVSVFRRVQERFPESEKMHIWLAEYEGKPVAAMVWSALGDTALPQVAATGNDGLKLYASYFLWWRVIEFFKKQGCRWLDLGGIDPIKNPGGYHFKNGLGGKDCCYIGEFEVYKSSLSKVLVTVGEGIKKKMLPCIRGLLKTGRG